MPYAKIKKSSQNSKVNEEKNYGFGVRHIQVFLAFMCLTVGYIMRVNMSVAILAMTDKTSSDIQTYDWDKKTQDIILSSFFIGYTMMQIPASQLAQRYGAKILFVAAMLINGITTLSIPWFANFGGWISVCACRVLQGLTQGSLFPSIYTLIGKWVPNNERSRLSNIMYSGTSIGTITGMPLTSILASTSIGWPLVFYVIGSLAIFTGFIMLFFGANTPSSHKSITKAEKRYIESSIGKVEENKKLKTPWKSIATSVPLIAIAVAHIGCNWGFIIFLVETPSYLKRALDIDMKKSGLFSALPYIALFIGGMALSFISDFVVNRNIWSVTFTRKFFNSIGMWVPATGLIILGFIPKGHEIIAITLIVIIVGSFSGMNMGYMMNPVDLSPNFAGTLISITNSLANGIGVLAPITAGLILTDDTDLVKWRIVFMLASVICFIANLFYIIFGTSERQDWNEPISDNAKEMEVALNEVDNKTEDKLLSSVKVDS